MTMSFNYSHSLCRGPTGLTDSLPQVIPGQTGGHQGPGHTRPRWGLAGARKLSPPVAGKEGSAYAGPGGPAAGDQG